MKELGEYLKSTRISNGVSIEEAAEDLEFSASQLENIECGNTKAFKDVYSLKQYVRQYAKYLGLDPEKVVDEFNDFLFQHTSKISLDDILEAKKKLEEKDRKEKKINSPYTIIPKKKVAKWPFIAIFLGVVFISLFIYLVISSINKAPSRDSELIGNTVRRENIYEFTY